MATPLAASEKRLKPLRGFRGAALPGQSLGGDAPELGLTGAEDGEDIASALGRVLRRRPDHDVFDGVRSGGRREGAGVREWSPRGRAIVEPLGVPTTGSR